MNTDIKVGLSCNNACVHCIMMPVVDYKSENNEKLDDSFDEIKKKIVEAKNIGYDSISLTGGEITIRKDFTDLVKFGLNLGLSVTVQTNARQLSKIDKIKPLLNTDRNKLSFVIEIGRAHV